MHPEGAQGTWRDLPKLLRFRSERGRNYARVFSDLAVEVIYPGSARLDRGAKRKLYAARGVRYYWIVDPRARRVEEYELAGAVYRLRSRVEGASTFRPALFPDFELPLGQVWVENA